MAEELELVKISQLPETSNVAATDVVPVVQNGTTKKASLPVIRDYVVGELGSAAQASTTDFEPAGAIAEVENQLAESANQQNERIDRLEYSIYLIQKNGLFKAYRTKALMLADVAIIPVNSIVSVVNDPANNAQTNDINGEYHYNGTDFFKLPSNLLDQLNIKTAAAEANAKSYADVKKAEAIQTAAFDAQIKAEDARHNAELYTKSKIGLGLREIVSTSILPNYYIQFDGNTGSMLGFQQTKFKIKAGKKYRLVALITSPKMPNNNWKNFGLFAQSKTETINLQNIIEGTLELRQASLTDGAYIYDIDIDIDAVSDANYLIVSQKVTDNLSLFEYYNLDDRIDTIDVQLPQIALNNSRISVLESNLKSNTNTLANPLKSNNLYINYAGTANNDTLYEIQRFDVNVGDVVFIEGLLTAANPTGNNPVGVLGFYATTSMGSMIAGSLITQTKGTTASYNYSLLVPAGAKYLNVSIKKGVDTVNIKKTYSLGYLATKFENVLTCIGDSITWGSAPEDNVTWAQRLQVLVGNKTKVLNCGVGGDGIWQISARMGAIPAVNAIDFVLPASSADAVQVGKMTNYIYDGFFKSSYDTTKNVVFLAQGETGRWESVKTVNPVFIDGIECTLSVNKVDAGNMTWYLKRNTDGSTARTIYAKSQIATNGAKINSIASVIWIGTNESFSGGVIDTDVYIDVIKKNIEYRGSNKYVVIGVYGGTGISGMSVAQLETLEARMRKEFGGHFINIRKYVTTNALVDASISPTSMDDTAINQGKCPPSLLIDGLHPNAAFCDLIAKKVYENLLAQGF